jgi:hypothetical protein
MRPPCCLYTIRTPTNPSQSTVDDMRELIAHPAIQFWGYALSGRLTYTTLLPRQLPQKHELSPDRFIGVKLVKAGDHAKCTKGTEIWDAAGMRIIFTKNDGAEINVQYFRPDGHELKWTIGHLKDANDGVDAEVSMTPDSTDFAWA